MSGVVFWYRITKYNPQFRDHAGAYGKEDWISFSDIGSSFGNKVLSAEDYLNTEEAYIEAISLFMEECKVDTLSIKLLSKHDEPKKKDVWYSLSLLETYQAICDNVVIKKNIVLDVARLALREYIWCKLESEKMFVHFGYDYYMYIGTQKKPTSVLSQIESLGLFLEQIEESPYARTAYEDDEKKSFVERLNISDGIVGWDSFDIDEDIPFDQQAFSLTEDMLQIAFGDRFIIDVGWQPDLDPKGSFILYVIQDEDWDNPVSKKTCNSLRDLKIIIEDAVRLITTLG